MSEENKPAEEVEAPEVAPAEEVAEEKPKKKRRAKKKAEPAPEAPAKHMMLGNVKHNGRRYKKGCEYALSAEDEEKFKALGVIE